MYTLLFPLPAFSSILINVLLCTSDLRTRFFFASKDEKRLNWSCFLKKKCSETTTEFACIFTWICSQGWLFLFFYWLRSHITLHEKLYLIYEKNWFYWKHWNKKMETCTSEALTLYTFPWAFTSEWKKYACHQIKWTEIKDLWELSVTYIHYFNQISSVTVCVTQY